MKKMNKLTVAALALTAVGFASTAASAQVVTSTGDLVLGFQLAGNPTDLEVDLGSQSLFTPTAVLNLSSDLSVNDLTNTFGANWTSGTSGTGVQWSVSGDVPGSGVSKYNLDVTSTVTLGSASGTGANILKPYNVDIANLVTGGGGLSGATAAGTSVSALIGSQASPASGIANSYTSQEPQIASLTANIEQTGAGSVDLFQYQATSTSAGTVVDLGTFTLGSNGSLNFNGISATATPEPSAYALGICAALLFLVLRRRASVA